MVTSDFSAEEAADEAVTAQTASQRDRRVSISGAEAVRRVLGGASISR